MNSLRLKNVILLTVDTLRKDVLGCYNPESKLTPFIDSLQDRCIKFTNMQAIGPYTQASFPGILTSSYYFDWGRHKKCPPQRILISEVLKKGGITTAGIHSNPYISEFFGWNRGWDFFYDSMEEEVTDEVPYIKGDKINKKVDEWLSSHIKGKDYGRFFLWMHYMDVHEPYVPERRYVEMVDPSIKLSSNEMFNLFKNVILKRDVSDKEKVELLKKLYFAHVREIDEYVQDFFSILKRYDLLENSTVIITSDHGDEFGEHGGLSHDGKFYSELINVPFLIYNPGEDEGKVCDKLVSNIDIPPTILHIFGLEQFKGFKGHSLLPLENYPEKGCFGEAIDKRSAHEKETDKPTYYYQEEKLKIIYRESTDTWEMYDLRDDPRELNNIVNISTGAESMKQILKPRIGRWLKDK
ncbi:sulfatase [Candidatus Aerophobetes bacterium]|nr:sulfatase [Candidatus Aerophobetes bacterium]